MSQRISKLIIVLSINLISGQDPSPFITSITSATSDGSYKLSSEINITVNFNELVTLTDAKLEIILETGETDRSVYIPAFSDPALSASTTYIVQQGDETEALSVNSITLSATGSLPSIKDGTDNAMINFTPVSNLNSTHTILIDGVIPESPIGLSALAGDKTITLNWTANSEIDFGQYVIYGGEVQAPTIVIATITSISQVSQPILSLTNDVTYYYRITSEDTLGNTSGYSTEVSGTPFSRPVAKSIRDGISTTEDLDWWNSRSTLSFNWESFEDNGTVDYEYAVSTSLTDLTNTINWKAVTDTNTQVTIPGLNLIEGFTYYLSVRGTDITSKSDTATSDGITLDLTGPITGTVNDGSSLPGVDLTFINSTDKLGTNWNGFQDIIGSGVASGIKSYTISLGTSPSDTNILGPKLYTLRDSATVSELDLLGDSTYYFSVFAMDSAGNISSTATSNGITIDIEPPRAGEVMDITAYNFILGDLSDQDWININSSLVTYWRNFSDALSGIASYEASVLDSNEIPIIEWRAPLTDSTAFIIGLSLEDAKTYKTAVKTTDVAGNITIGTSNGITVDLTPPSFQSQTTQRIPLTDTSLVKIIFSEAISSLQVTASTLLADTVLFKYLIKEDTLLITTLPPFASLDTVTFTLTNVTDMRDLVTDSIQVHFETRMLGDYNDNLIIDIDDITNFAEEWPSVDIAPVFGSPPFFVLAPDDTTNLRDAMAFSKMWRWSNQENISLSNQRLQIGQPLSIKPTNKGFVLTLPHSTRSGEIEIISSIQNVTLMNEVLSDNGLILSNYNQTRGSYHIVFALYELSTKNEETKFNFLLNDSRDEMVLNYIFFDLDKKIQSSGTTKLLEKLTPANYALHANNPNPFNPVTSIPYDIFEIGPTKIIIYDLMGRNVRTLINEEISAGFHSVIWDGRDDLGKPLASGVFVVRMISGSFTAAQKLLLLK